MTQPDLRCPPGCGCRRHSSPEDIQERFWAKVDRSGDCWEWTRTLVNGYGVFSIGTKRHLAHRVSYEWEYGEIPTDRQLDHICVNHPCVRPEHLRVVTKKQQQEHMPGARGNSKSGVRGVYWHGGPGGRYPAWVAKVTHDKKQHFVGRFKTLEEAEAAVIAKRLELFTHNDVDRSLA